MTNETIQSIMNFIEREILMRHRCLSNIQTDGDKPYLSAGINNFFSKFNIVHEVAAPYHPESNEIAEQLIRSLKDQLHHVNKDQGFNLQRNLNIAVSAYWMVPHRATVSCPLYYSMVVRQPHHMKSHSPGTRWRNSTKTPLVLNSQDV